MRISFLEMIISSGITILFSLIIFGIVGLILRKIKSLSKRTKLYIKLSVGALPVLLFIGWGIIAFFDTRMPFFYLVAFIALYFVVRKTGLISRKVMIFQGLLYGAFIVIELYFSSKYSVRDAYFGGDAERIFNAANPDKGGSFLWVLFVVGLLIAHFLFMRWLFKRSNKKFWTTFSLWGIQQVVTGAFLLFTWTDANSIVDNSNWGFESAFIFLIHFIIPFFILFLISSIVTIRDFLRARKQRNEAKIVNQKT